MIEHPNLECSQCLKLYKSDGHLPECFRPEGCPVEDLATDAELSAKVNKFLTAKALFNVTELPTVQEKIFAEIGLLDDPQTHLEAERIYSKWTQLQIAQRKQSP